MYITYTHVNFGFEVKEFRWTIINSKPAKRKKIIDGKGQMAPLGIRTLAYSYQCFTQALTTARKFFQFPKQACYTTVTCATKLWTKNAKTASLLCRKPAAVAEILDMQAINLLSSELAEPHLPYNVAEVLRGTTRY